MRKALVSLGLLLMAGCSAQIANHHYEFNPVPAGSVTLQLESECGLRGRLTQVGKGVVIEDVRVGEILEKNLIPPILSSERFVTVTYQVLSADGRMVLGSATQSFPFDDVLSTASWKIGGGYGGGYNVHTDHVYDSHGRDVCLRNYAG